MFQALEYGGQFSREELHYHELGIAQLTSIYYNSQKTKPPYTKPNDFCLFAPKNEHITQTLVVCINELINKELIPSWCLRLIPEEILKKESTGKVRGLKAVSTFGMYLFLPSQISDSLTFAMGIFTDKIKPGQYILYGVDSDEKFEVSIDKFYEDMIIYDGYLILKTANEDNDY